MLLLLLKGASAAAGVSGVYIERRATPTAHLELTSHRLNRGRLAWYYSTPRLGGGVALYDVSGNQLHATGRSTAQRAAGVRSEVVGHRFSSTATGVVDLPSGVNSRLSGIAAASFAAWVRPSAWSTESAPINAGVGNNHYPFSGTTVYCTTFRFNRVNNFASLYPDARWRRVVVTTQAGGSWVFYENGQVVTSVSAEAVVSLSGGGISIGSGDVSDSTLSGANIADVGFWTRALSPEEVFEDYVEGLRGYPTVLRQGRTAYISVPGAGGTPGNATGTTLTATLSLTTGGATGAAAAAGATLTATTSLVAGVATGAASAAGVTLTDTLSFIPGAATVGGAGNAAGVTLPATTSLLAGAASGAASAAGTTLTATLSLIPGAASAGAVVAGVALTATTSFAAGAATGAAAAAGSVLTSALAFTPGFATGAGLSSAPGAQITVTTSLITGTAETFATPENDSRIRIGGRVMTDTTRIGSAVLRKSNRPIRH